MNGTLGFWGVSANYDINSHITQVKGILKTGKRGDTRAKGSPQCLKVPDCILREKKNARNYGGPKQTKGVLV